MKDNLLTIKNTYRSVLFKEKSLHMKAIKHISLKTNVLFNITP